MRAAGNRFDSPSMLADSQVKVMVVYENQAF